MKLFVGLGNPGKKYARHRHNVGQTILDLIASRSGGGKWVEQPEGAVFETMIGSEQVIFLKPSTKMNVSGRAVAEAQNRLGLALSDIFVFYDDVDLAPGRLKVKRGGSAGGHNGISSISATIGLDYHRVRIGVGRPAAGSPMSEHVLGNFSKSDDVWLAQLADAMAAAMVDLIEDRGDTFLNKVGRLAPPQKIGQAQAPENAESHPRASRHRRLTVKALVDNARGARQTVKTFFRLRTAKIKRSKSTAKFIAVTGSSAKTTTAKLIGHILQGHGKVLAQHGNNSYQTTLNTLGSIKSDHDYVVTELGSSGPGTIRPMADVVKPDIVVITTVGMDHYAAFRGKDAVAIEKGSLVQTLRQGGTAILNADDPNVSVMPVPQGAKAIRYGLSDGEYGVGDIDARVLGQLSFNLTHRQRSLRLRTKLTGAHNYLAVSAAAACALELGVPEEIIIDRIGSFEPVFSRLSVHSIPQGPTFLLDTRKAPYDTLSLCLDTLRDCEAPRKRFVLGGLSDYPGDPSPKFRNAYRMAREVADQVIFSGEYGHHARATKEESESGKFISFSSIGNLLSYLKDTAIDGEVILIKAPSGLHFERIYLGWSGNVLCWEDACGNKSDCLKCGRFAEPFEMHRGKRRKRDWNWFGKAALRNVAE